MSVDEIMRRWPATVRVFIRRDMLCPGCPAAAFHALDDAARLYGLCERELWDEIISCAEETATDGDGAVVTPRREPS